MKEEDLRVCHIPDDLRQEADRLKLSCAQLEQLCLMRQAQIAPDMRALLFDTQIPLCAKKDLLDREKSSCFETIRQNEARLDALGHLSRQIFIKEKR